MGSKAYGSSGVDLEAGYEAVRRYKKHVKSTIVLAVFLTLVHLVECLIYHY